jgi:hypothetical protein
MILELQLHFREHSVSLRCDDLPGLCLWSDSPDKIMADFMAAWRKMHEIAPHQVMPVPKTSGALKPMYEGKKRGGKAGGVARAANLSPERRKEIAKKAASARWKK